MNGLLRGPCFALLTLLALSACRTVPDFASGFHFPVEKGDITQGRNAFVSVGCPQCHTVAGADLSDYAGQRFITMPLGGELKVARTYGDLVTSIINPNHVISEIYLDQLPPERRRLATTTPMYTEFDMKVTELVDIVAFLNSRYSLVSGYTGYYYPGSGQDENSGPP